MLTKKKSTKILVTGSEGFIAKDLISKLKKDNYIVYTLDLKKNKSNIATLIGNITGKQKADRNTVKAIIDHQEIVMFTRSPLFGSPLFIKRHIGIYGFSIEMTERINKNIMIETSNEIVENLEQIRWGDNGIKFSSVNSIWCSSRIFPRSKQHSHFLLSI